MLHECVLRGRNDEAALARVLTIGSDGFERRQMLIQGVV